MLALLTFSFGKGTGKDSGTFLLFFFFIVVLGKDTLLHLQNLQMF
jgi:hypothetical protein